MLNQEQIDFFHHNGFLIMRGLVQGNELETLQTETAKVIEAGIHRTGEHHLYLPGPHGNDVYWRSERMWERGDIFRAVAVHPDLLENIGQCIGQAFYPWNDSLVVKVAEQGAAVKWHQDPPYGRVERETTYPVPNFTTDIYLDHSGTDNGCVYAIPGHHLVGHVDWTDKTDEELFQHPNAVPIEMEAGDVLFHCLSTPHGSRANTSSIMRRIFYIHYIAEEVYQEGYGAEPWAVHKPGWGEARKTLLENMMECREASDLEAPLKRETLCFSEGGFQFMGIPTSPVRFWETLSSEMPPEVRSRLKKL